MTRDEILAMPAGDTMDITIDWFVFGIESPAYQVDIYLDEEGWCVNPISKRRIRTGNKPSRPSYSTDISAAWEVVEKLAVEPFAWSIESINEKDGLRWFVCYWGDGSEPGTILDWSSDTEESLPLSICRVALMAVMEKQCKA